MYNEGIYVLLSGPLIGHHVFNLGKPCDILLGAGIPDKPIQILKGTLRRKIKRHGLNIEQLIDLPKHLNSPIFVMKSLTESNSVTAFTEIELSDGNILVVIDVDGEHNSVEINKIVS
jgi:hypothetical protein